MALNLCKAVIIGERCFKNNGGASWLVGLNILVLNMLGFYVADSLSQ